MTTLFRLALLRPALLAFFLTSLAWPTQADDRQNQRELTLAQIFMDQNRPDLACTLLWETQPASVTDPDRLYLLAHCSTALNQLNAAAAYYRRLIELLPDAPTPRAELAALHLATGDQQRGAQLLADAARRNPPSEATDAIARLAEQLGSDDPASLLRHPRSKPWSVQLYGGLSHDDNVNGGPNSSTVPAVIGGTPVNFELVPSAMPRSSMGSTFNLSGQYIQPLSQRWAMLYQGVLGATHYFSEQDFNNDTGSASGALLYRDQTRTFSLQPNVRYTRQDGQLQESVAGLVARVTEQGPLWAVTLSGGYFQRNVRVDDARDASGIHGSVGLSARFTPRWQAGAEYAWQREDADNDVFSRTLQGPMLFTSFAFTPHLSIMANYRRDRVEYEDPMMLFPTARRDRQGTRGLTVLWDISQWAGHNLVLRGQYHRITNPSNIGYNDYDREIASLGAQLQF